MIGITVVMSLLIVSFLTLTIMKQVRHAPDEVERPVRVGMLVVATITDVQRQQNWKDGERWERNPWTGNIARQKTWQICYDVTAQWLHAKTGQRFAFRSTVWADEIAKTPTAGDTIVVVFDLHHPQRSCVDFRSLS